MDYYTVVVEGVEKVSSIVTYYSIVEQLYLHRSSEAVSHLEESLVDLYVGVLLFISKARRFYKRSTSSM